MVSGSSNIATQWEIYANTLSEPGETNKRMVPIFLLLGALRIQKTLIKPACAMGHVSQRVVSDLVSLDRVASPFSAHLLGLSNASPRHNKTQISSLSLLLSRWAYF